MLKTGCSYTETWPLRVVSRGRAFRGSRRENSSLELADRSRLVGPHPEKKL